MQEDAHRMAQAGMCRYPAGVDGADGGPERLGDSEEICNWVAHLALGAN